MTKHTILFLAANPRVTDSGGLDLQARRGALDREASAIQKELKRSGYRDRFELVSRLAAEPHDLLRGLRELKPTVVHFSGRGGRDGLFFETPNGDARVVSPAAIAETFGAAGSSVKLVVLSACYSEAPAEALLAHVDCVVGMSGVLDDGMARAFVIGFYGALGDQESVLAAYMHGNAAISLEGLADADRPQLKVRAGVDAAGIVLAAVAPSGSDDVDNVSNADYFDELNLVDVGSQRFGDLCFYLARAELGFVRRIATSSDEDLVVVMHVPDKAAAAISILICKAGARNDEELITSIEASLNASPDYVAAFSASWTLCVPTKPTTKLRTWFEAEMRRRRSEFDIWDEIRLRTLLVKHQAVLEVFFYHSSADVRRRHIVGDLELYELSLDLGRGWHQADVDVLALFRATEGTADLVLDVIVRNCGEHEEVLTQIVANVSDALPVAHGLGGTSLLHRPEIAYVVSLGGGQDGNYSAICEPRLAIQGHRSGRVAVRLVDTGYSWTGFVRVGLVFGKQTLLLPYLRLWT